MGDKVLYKQAKYTLEKEIRVAKRNYSGKLRNKFSSSDSASVWKGMKDFTNYKTTIPQHCGESQLADDLNDFCCRFEKTSHTHPETPLHTPLTPPATPLSPTPALEISEDDVRQVFIKNKEGKHQAQTVCHQPALKPVLTTHLQQITGAVRSPLMLQTLHHHPRPKETQNYWT